MNYIIEKISDNDFALVVALAAALTVLWFGYKLVRFIGSLGAEISETRQVRGEVKPIIRQWPKLTADVETLKSDVGILKTQMVTVVEKVSGLDIRMSGIENKIGNPAFFGSNSPMVLNERAKRISNFINAESIANKYAGEVKFDKETGYDIQVACFNFAENELPKKISKEQLEIMKEAAFREGVKVNHIFPIYAIPMRDKILSEKGISINKKLEDG